MRINIPGMEMINIDEIIERAPRPKGRRINVTPKKKTKAAVKPKAKVKAKAKPKRKPRRISTPRTFGEEINLPEIGSILPRLPKPPVIEPKGKTPVSKRPRPTFVDTTPKPKAPSIPSSRDVEKIIADLGIEIPEVINIPGVGQVRIPSVPAAPKAPVSTQPDTIIESSLTEQTPTGTYESSYIDWLESEPQKPTVRPARKLPGGGPRYKEAQEQYRQDLANWEASKPVKDTFTAPAPAPSPVETQPDTITQPVPDYIKNPPPAPPVNPFEGFVPRNIIGPSFDPKDVSAQRQMVADARARMTPGANIQGGGYLTYDNPMLGNKQTQFGGYGQPMPTAPLMNYAGLSSPITYSTPAPDPDKEIIR